MLMVVILHVLNHGGLLEATERFPFKNEVLWFIEILALCAVNCYALISGYVGVYAKHRYSNLVVLWLRVVFYSVLIAVAFMIFMPDVPINIRGFLTFFCPVISDKYWYFTSYFLLFLFMPFLNVALNNISKQVMKKFLLSVLLCTSIVAPVADILSANIWGLGVGYTTFWLMILYMLGGYIRKFGLLINLRKIWLLLAYLSFALITLLSRWIISVVRNLFFIEILSEEMWTSYISITILAEAVCLLLLFERVKLSKFKIRIIAFLSPLAFSVYLIHEHPYVREYLITDRFLGLANYNWIVMILAVIATVIAIFIICIIIDFFRNLLFKVIKVKQRVNSLENKISNRLIKE